MIAFADTSGLYALMAGNDGLHTQAQRAFSHLADVEARIMTTSYVLVETIALLQHRIGLEAVQTFEARFVPLLEIVWVDAPWHECAMRRLALENRREVSLVDCLSFEVMQTNNLNQVFGFDKHFQQAGFELIGQLI